MCSHAMARRWEHFPEMLQQRRAHLQRVARDEGRQQLHRRLQPQHRQRHAHGLHRLGQAVQRAVGQPHHSGGQGHVGRRQLLQRGRVQFGRRHDLLQAQQRFGARRDHDGTHGRVYAGLPDVLVDGVWSGHIKSPGRRVCRPHGRAQPAQLQFVALWRQKAFCPPNPCTGAGFAPSASGPGLRTWPQILAPSSPCRACRVLRLLRPGMASPR